MQYEKTREVLEPFECEGVMYAIFGGAALNLHGLARATQVRTQQNNCANVASGTDRKTAGSATLVEVFQLEGK